MGVAWFNALLSQNPRWVRGTATPATLILNETAQDSAATFTAFLSFSPDPSLQANVSFPKQGFFVSWPQTGAILKAAPHPEGAKLFHNWLVSEERQNTLGWSVLRDSKQSDNFPYPDIWRMPGTNPAYFAKWMEDRARMERLRNFFENRLGTPQGLSPLIDSI